MIAFSNIGSRVKVVVNGGLPNILSSKNPLLEFQYVSDNKIAFPLHPQKALSLSEITLNDTVPESIEQFETLMKEVFPNSEENMDESLIYYAAFLNQAGTDNPTATIIKSETGNIIWTREGVGLYKGFLLNGFPFPKITGLISSNGNFFNRLEFQDESTIIIETLNSNYELADGQLVNTLFKIQNKLAEALLETNLAWQLSH